MKANVAARRSRASRRDDSAASEVVGAVILFGIFIATLAILNLTAVPNAGKAAEQQHARDLLADLNGLQASAEGIAVPSAVGASVARSISLAPSQHGGSDFMSLFLATPATASGEISFAADYGRVRLSHATSGGGTVYDIGNATTGIPLGRVLLDPHPYFASPGTDALEDGAVVAATSSNATLRFAPPITVKLLDGATHLTVLARVFDGPDLDIGGTTSARVALTTEAASMSAPVAPNAASVTLRIETSYGDAWRAYLASAVPAGVGFTLTVAPGAGHGGLDVVTWTVTGAGTGNDIALTSGLAVFRVGFT